MKSTPPLFSAYHRAQSATDAQAQATEPASVKECSGFLLPPTYLCHLSATVVPSISPNLPSRSPPRRNHVGHTALRAALRARRCAGWSSVAMRAQRLVPSPSHPALLFRLPPAPPQRQRLQKARMGSVFARPALSTLAYLGFFTRPNYLSVRT